MEEQLGQTTEHLNIRTFLVDQWLRALAPNPGGPGSIPDQENIKVRYCALPVALPSSMACLVPVPFAPPAGEEIEGQEAPVLPPQPLPLQVEKRGHSERLTARKRQNRVFWRLHRARSQEAWLLPATRWHRS